MTPRLAFRLLLAAAEDMAWIATTPARCAAGVVACRAVRGCLR